MQARLKVALVFGGRSGEHEVSLRSALSVAEGLGERHDVLPLFVDKAGGWRLQSGGAPSSNGGVLRSLADARELARPDVFFPVLHGTYGEDGTVQGLFELASVPYVGSGVLGSALGMDKVVQKSLWRGLGLPVVDFLSVLRHDVHSEAVLDRIEQTLGYPCFVKPANLGSSVGVSKARGRDELREA